MLDLKGHYLNNSFLKDSNFKLILNVLQIPNVFSLNVFLKYSECFSTLRWMYFANFGLQMAAQLKNPDQKL